METFFIQSATADVLVTHIKEAINNGNLLINKFLMLGMDGPNVNKVVYNKLNDEVKEARTSGLVNIGSCNLHCIHNSFHKGLTKYGNDVSDLII